MQCPIDDTTLAMTERQGIEIDYCPKCRGVWLDRGELDKLIDAGSSTAAVNYRPDQPPRYKEHPDERTYKYEKKRKKDSFLGDLFDF
jgi:Zn-finger nucleic acid-binding protein